MRRLASAATVALVAGCTPPQGFLPGPTLPWWLVFVIIGGFVLYVYLRRGK